MTLDRDPDLLVVFTTAPDAQTGARIARALVERGLAACVNLLPGATSVYRWQGKVDESSEVLLVVKTARARLPELGTALSELHPYELPELLALPVAGAEAGYRAWVLESTR
jgi:periplasmic divalent cation tolerance protein